MRSMPDHPGLAHYIIHSYDYPPLADRALEAARRYGTIAPDSPHARHMPSHTFTRVGYWQESVDANIASAEASRRDGVVGEELHTMDYRIYAYLQMAQDVNARAIVEALPQVAGRYSPTANNGATPPLAVYFAIAAMPARFALERGAWSEAAALTPQRSDYPFAEALTYFRRRWAEVIAAIARSSKHPWKRSPKSQSNCDGATNRIGRSKPTSNAIRRLRGWRASIARPTKR